MFFVPKSRYQQLFSSLSFAYSQRRVLCSSNDTYPRLQELRCLMSAPLGSLGELESRLEETFKASLSSSLVSQVIESSEPDAPTRRLLRFFLWSNKNLKSDLVDADFNRSIRFFAAKKDYAALKILTSDMMKEGREMEAPTFSAIAEALVKLDRAKEALGMFTNLENYKCPRDSSMVVSLVRALCFHGHVKEAEGIVKAHWDKLANDEEHKRTTFKSLIHGWCEQENPKAARRVMKEMKFQGIKPDLFCYNSFLRCLCEQNLKKNPHDLVPVAFDVMMEMRTNRLCPNPVSYNVVLSCLGRAMRFDESCQLLERMSSMDCSPDCMSYFLVIRALCLSSRFEQGINLYYEMIGKGIKPDSKFYHEMIPVLCNVERIDYALELFDRMKQCGTGDYGPIYDVLIKKLCTNGHIKKGRDLWDEAKKTGVELRCSNDVFDPAYLAAEEGIVGSLDYVVVQSKRKVLKKVEKVRIKSEKKKFGIRLKPYDFCSTWRSTLKRAR